MQGPCQKWVRISIYGRGIWELIEIACKHRFFWTFGREKLVQFPPAVENGAPGGDQVLRI
jgi:hypothetical protein